MLELSSYEPFSDTKLNQTIAGVNGYYGYFKVKVGNVSMLEMKRISNFILEHKFEVKKHDSTARFAAFTVTLFIEAPDSGAVTGSKIYEDRVIQNTVFATSNRFTRWLKDIDGRLWFKGNLDSLLVNIIRDDVPTTLYAELVEHMIAS